MDPGHKARDDSGGWVGKLRAAQPNDVLRSTLGLWPSVFARSTPKTHGLQDVINIRRRLAIFDVRYVALRVRPPIEV